MRPPIPLLVLALCGAPAAFAVGSFDNPPDGQPASGIALVSGFHCTATTIEIEIDGVRKLAAAGTDRPDTLQLCGKRNTGFGLLVNWGDFGPGMHTVKAFADGVQFDATHTVTVPDLGGAFLFGKSGEAVVNEFPSEGRQLVLEWREGLQGFVVTQARSAPSIGGRWNGPNLEQRSNCAAAQNNGARGTYAQWDATLDRVSHMLRIQETGITGLSCNYSGSYRVNGNRMEWYDGTYTCTDGKTGTFHSTDFMVSDHAFSIRLATRLTGSETCDIDAILGGNRF
jgi:hypothetical protein